MATKRFSRLLSFPESKREPDNNDDRASNERKQLKIGPKRPPQLLSNTINDSREKFPLSRAEDDSEVECRRQDDISSLVFKLLHIHSSTKQRRDVSAQGVSKVPPRKIKEEVKIIMRMRQFWKQKQCLYVPPNTNPETISLPLLVVRNSIRRTHQNQLSSSVRESTSTPTFSALSSTTLTSELIILTADQSSILVHLTRKVGRSLKQQERLTANFSTNLAHLFVWKKRTFKGNQRLSWECKKTLILVMNSLRELVGRTFLKKAAIVERSVKLVLTLGGILGRDWSELFSKDEAAEGDKSRSTLVSANATDPGQDTTSLVGFPKHGSLAPSLPSDLSDLLIPLAPSPPLVSELQLDIQNFRHSVQLLREGITIQQELDAALRAGIVGPCEDLRFPPMINERIAMNRFMKFVDMCLLNLGKRYEEEMMVLKVLEMLGDVLKSGGGGDMREVR